MAVPKVEVISGARVAEISEWRNNCAVSCTATFLVNAFISKPNKLSERAERSLVMMFNQYYHLSLSVEQLRELFLYKFTLPADRQVILGPVLRDFLNTVMPVDIKEAERDANMLSNEAFTHLAEEFGFNVAFYALLDKGNIQESGTIPSIIVDRGTQLTLRPYFNVHAKAGHYDLIMDDVDTVRQHNMSAFEESPYNLPVEKNQEEAFKHRIVELTQEHFSQQIMLDDQINKLSRLARSLEEQGSEYSEKVVLISSQLKQMCDAFFQRPFEERAAGLVAFKSGFLGIVNGAIPRVGWLEATGSMALWKSTPNQLLRDTLIEIARDVSALRTETRENFVTQTPPRL